MKSKDPVLDRMHEYVESWKASKDRRHVFLSCYHLMSSNMVQALESQEFHDPVWVQKLLHRFADYYFDNLRCFDCGDRTSKVWQNAHLAAKETDLSELQLLIVGVNAHINYDLVFALYDLLKPEWESLSEEKKHLRYEDHCHVNKVIAKTIDRVQDEILEPDNPTLEWVDRLFGRMDEFLISKLITKWRDDVWENTQHLLTMDSEKEKELFRKKIESDVIQLEKTIRFF